MDVPSRKLTVEFPPGLVAVLTELHKQGQQSYPEPPSADLLEKIEVAEDELNKLANAQIRDYASELVTAGERPWFEVWYPQTRAADFDAVEVVAGVHIITLPHYKEIPEDWDAAAEYQRRQSLGVPS